MKRSNNFNLCEERLSWLCTRIELRGKQNVLDFHIHSEDFYADFLNLLFGYRLENINRKEQNAEGIDLVDSFNKIVLQVSATATKSKIESTLSRDLSDYAGYRFLFVSLSKDASVLRKNSYNNPHNLLFDSANDIYDVASLLNHIHHLDAARQTQIASFLEKELPAGGTEKTLEDTNIAAVIKILAQENLSGISDSEERTPFNIDDKLTFNRLQVAATLIEDYKVYQALVDRIYSEFDKAGQNKSKSVLESLRYSYIQLSGQYTADDLFFQIVDRALAAVQQSANYNPIPSEELRLCINIVVVDAFIRCRIFRNPEDTKNVMIAGVENVVA